MVLTKSPQESGGLKMLRHSETKTRVHTTQAETIRQTLMKKTMA